MRQWRHDGVKYDDYVWAYHTIKPEDYGMAVSL